MRWLISILILLLATAAYAADPTHPAPVTGITNVPTYSASASFSNSSAGDALCINGSATQIVRVTHMRITALASALVTQDVSVIRRSTADTGGGKTALTLVPNDSSDAAATAAVSYFTSAPTAGTAVGHIDDRMLTIVTTSTGTVSEGLIQYADNWAQPMVLRGTGEGLCVSVPATAGGTWAIHVEWTETPQ